PNLLPINFKIFFGRTTKIIPIALICKLLLNIFFFKHFFENLEGDDTRTQSESTNQANRKK
ncbi:hypothetical protein, partial [uncultured Dysgonomonas sp.]|uniref:hypothetical protein n=1 Tax=uncultured Dysgonomonas sp. TaxID=206096 RepID=UPI002805B4FE